MVLKFGIFAIQWWLCNHRQNKGISLKKRVWTYLLKRLRTRITKQPCARLHRVLFVQFLITTTTVRHCAHYNFLRKFASCYYLCTWRTTIQEFDYFFPYHARPCKASKKKQEETSDGHDNCVTLRAISFSCARLLMRFMTSDILRATAKRVEEGAVLEAFANLCRKLLQHHARQIHRIVLASLVSFITRFIQNLSQHTRNSLFGILV